MKHAHPVTDFHLKTISFQFNGNASFTFPYTELMESNTQVKVKVTEDETGVTGSSESRVQVYERDVKIEFTEQTPAVFKPKLPFTAYVSSFFMLLYVHRNHKAFKAFTQRCSPVSSRLNAHLSHVVLNE